MSVEAYEVATVGNNLPFAATIGMVLLIVTLAILGIYQYLVKSVARGAMGARGA
jgi:putative spermidine/putrescine transport system permease protein